MLTLNASLKRSVTERWARARKEWSQYDGLVRVTDATRPFLQKQRLNARPYSVSALQQFAACPYRFFLSAAYRLSPLEEPEPLQRMDPLTKGSLFHQVQAEFFRALQKAKLSIATGPRDRDPRDARRHARAHRRGILRTPRAGDRSRLAGRNREHAHRSARVGRPACDECRVGAVAVRVCVRPARTARTRSSKPQGSGHDRRKIHPSRLGRSRRAQTRDEDSAGHRSQDRERTVPPKAPSSVGERSCSRSSTASRLRRPTRLHGGERPLLVLHDAGRLHRSRRSHQRADAADGHRSARDHRSRRRARHAAAGSSRQGLRHVRLSHGLRPRSGAAASKQVAKSNRRSARTEGAPVTTTIRITNQARRDRAADRDLDLISALWTTRSSSKPPQARERPPSWSTASSASSRAAAPR